MKKIVVIRRITGDSMLPGLGPGRIVVGWKFGIVRNGDIVIFAHDGLEKVKRISRIENGRLYVLGDNPAASTDSRQFGWIDRSSIIATVIWPRLK